MTEHSNSGDPLGWPDTFVEFLNAQHEHRMLVPELMSSADWRRSLSYRATDEYVRTTLGIVPLSVSADRIGITAMRAARLQVLLAVQLLARHAAMRVRPRSPLRLTAAALMHGTGLLPRLTMPAALLVKYSDWMMDRC